MKQIVSFIYLTEILHVIWQNYLHVIKRLYSPFPGGSWIFYPHLVLLRDWTGSLHICPENNSYKLLNKVFFFEPINSLIQLVWSYQMSTLNSGLYVTQQRTYKTTRVIIADCLCISKGFQQRIGLQYHIFDSL